ncbi:MAG: DUF1292 domain-containing protein [Bacillota bacterium]|nr:DUF1292 domain-containing protein [Bacillota bacterium]
MQKLAFEDDQGQYVDFIVKAQFNIGYSKYIAILPVDEIQSPTYILKIEMDDNGNEVFVGIDDEELKEVSKAYEKVRNQNMQ